MGALLRQQMRLRQGPTGFVQGGKRGRTAGRRAAQRGAAWLNATEGSGDSKLGTTGGGLVRASWTIPGATWTTAKRFRS